jgi:hypothetical protein
VAKLLLRSPDLMRSNPPGMRVVVSYTGEKSGSMTGV